MVLCGSVNMEKAVSRKFTDEFEEGAELVTDQGHSPSELAQYRDVRSKASEATIVL